MITIQKFKELLSKAADGLAEEEVEQLRADMYQLVDLAFEAWLGKGGPQLLG